MHGIFVIHHSRFINVGIVRYIVHNCFQNISLDFTGSHTVLPLWSVLNCLWKCFFIWIKEFVLLDILAYLLTISSTVQSKSRALPYLEMRFRVSGWKRLVLGYIQKMSFQACVVVLLLYGSMSIEFQTICLNISMRDKQNKTLLESGKAINKKCLYMIRKMFKSQLLNTLWNLVQSTHICDILIILES